MPPIPNQPSTPTTTLMHRATFVRSALAGVLLCLLTLLSVLVPSPARADDKPQLYYAVHLDVDTEALLEHQSKEIVDAQADVLDNDLQGILKDHKIQLVEEPRDDAVHFRAVFAWRHYKGGVYLVTLAANRPDGNTHELSFEVVGSHFGVAEELETKIPQLLGWFEKPDEPAKTAPDVETANPPPPQKPDKPTKDRRASRLKGLVYGGIGIAVAGAGLSIAGGVYLGRRDRVVGDDGSHLRLLEDNRRIGAPLLGLGLGLVVAGAVMISVGAGVHAKRRRAKNSARLVINVGPGSAAAGLSARF